MEITLESRMKTLSGEMRLLLNLLSNYSSYMVEAADRPTDTRNINWDLFVELTVHHRIYPYLYPLLKKNRESLGVPVEIMQELQALYTRNTFQMLYFSGEMELLGRMFAENDIQCLFLKGPVLARDLYGDLSLRTSCDLDLLLPLELLERAEALLLQQGYIKDEYIRTVLNDWKWRHHHFVYNHPDKGIKVELHWRLNPAPSLEPSFGELWSRRRTSTLFKYPIYYLGQEDLFLFLVAHGARHGWSRIRWLLDIKQLLLQSLDARKLMKLLKDNHFFHIGGQALTLAEELLAAPIDQGLKPMRQSEKSMKLAEEAMFYVERMINLHSGPLPEEEDRYHKKHQYALLDPSRKILFLLSTLFPYPEDAERLPLPKSLHFLYFPLRPVLWMWRKIGGPQ
ncbi:nucleotidyltransferase family protein [Paenibacillus sp. sgz500958]|uniref:nucleotidyltransferase domain-containing protein n=1 Tax=Paenibacillus sp. sgz500958 TaxID=3242475 RepID=UPI0036D433B7